MHPEFAPIAFLAASSVLVVLPWHWRAGNVATMAIAFWLFITNVIYGVDALVWGNNVNIIIPVWCDITTKLITGSNVALPAACLCICIHLEKVASVRLAQTSLSDKRRRQIFEGVMSFGLPAIIMALHYIVQGHRFDIIEEYGCRPATYFSVAAIFIVWLPPLLLSIASLIFATLALRHFIRRRVSFAAHLDASHSALTTSRYLRLMLMSALQMVWSVAITSYALWFTTISIPIRPWTNWADVHSDFGRIDVFFTRFTPQIIVTTYYVLWWTVPASTFIFVAFFAFGRDALDEYKKCAMWFYTRVLRQTAPSKTSKGSFGTMPSFRSSPGKSITKQSMSASETTTSTSASLPPYTAPSPPSPRKYRPSLDDYDYDSHSDITHYGGKALGSLADLSPAPSLPLELPTTTFLPFSPHNHDENVPMTPLSPPSPLTPPPRHPRVLDAPGSPTPTSPRPVTYPSHDASHRGIIPPLYDMA